MSTDLHAPAQVMESYDLTLEGWIPVEDGEDRRDLGIAGVLRRSHRHRLAVADALEEVVLTRFLLAIVLDCFGFPKDNDEWADRWEAGRFDADRLDAYLDEHRDRLDLMDPTMPAMQVAGLASEKGVMKPASVLQLAAPTGNNVPLFAARTEADPPDLTLAEAARALLVVQGYDTAAIKTGAVGDPQAARGKTTGNPTGPLGQYGVLLPTGRSLFETLMLSVPVGLKEAVGDLPWWRREPATAAWQTRSVTGLVDLLTWQSRRVRLAVERKNDQWVVRRALVCAGDRLAQTPMGLEPHCLWQATIKPKPEEPPVRPYRLPPGRSLWRGLEGLLAIGGASDGSISSSGALTQIAELTHDGVLGWDFPLGVLGVGVAYGNQSAVVGNIIADAIPVPTAALGLGNVTTTVLVAIAQDAERLRQALNKLGDDVRRAVGGEPVPWDKSQRPGEQLLADLDPVVRRILAGLQHQPDRVTEALAAWRFHAKGRAQEWGALVVSCAPTTGFRGREVDKRRVTVPGAELRYRTALASILPGDTKEAS